MIYYKDLAIQLQNQAKSFTSYNITQRLTKLLHFLYVEKYNYRQCRFAKEIITPKMQTITNQLKAKITFHSSFQKKEVQEKESRVKNQSSMWSVHG